MGSYEDLVDTVHQNADRLERIEALLQNLNAESPFVTIQIIAKELNRSREWVSRHPWICPNFGKPDIDSRPKQWTRQNWDGWKVNLEENRRRWEAMTIAVNC